MGRIRMRNLKRFACLCLAVIMALGLLPVSAFASGTDGNTAGWSDYSGGQVIYTPNQDKCFVRVSLVELPTASATDVGAMKTIGTAIIHNGLPAEMNGIQSANMDIVEYVKGTYNNKEVSPTTWKAMEAAGVTFIDWTKEKSYADSNLDAKGKRPGLQFWTVNSGRIPAAQGSYGVTKPWMDATSSLTAFHSNYINSTTKEEVYAPTPFLEFVLSKLFKGNSDPIGTPPDYASLAKKWGMDEINAKKFPFVAKFMAATANSPVNLHPAGKFTGVGNQSVFDNTTSAPVCRYRLVVEPGLCLKNAPNGEYGGTWVSYTLREAEKIYAGKVKDINKKYVNQKISVPPALAGAFHTEKTEWYDVVFSDDGSDHAEFSFYPDGFLKSGAAAASQLTWTAALEGAKANKGYGVSILTPYDLGNPAPSGTGGSTKLKIKKIVDGDAGDGYFPIYAFVDARKFAIEVMNALPDDVKLKSLNITAGDGDGDKSKLIFAFANQDGKYKDLTLHDDLSDGSSTIAWIYGLLKNGGELEASVNWRLEYDDKKHTEDEIAGIINPHIEKIMLCAMEEPAWKEGATAAGADSILPDRVADAALKEGTCTADQLVPPGTTYNTTMSSPTDSLVAALDDTKWPTQPNYGFGNDIIDIGKDDSCEKLLGDSHKQYLTEGAIVYGPVKSADAGVPGGVIHAEPGDTVAELDINNSSGFRFRKKLGASEGSNVTADTEFEFKVTSITDNGAEIPGNTEISYCKDDGPAETKTYDELKNETLTAANAHGYTFSVPSTYEITIEEADDKGLGVSVFYSPGDDETGWTKLGDGKTGTLKSGNGDITFFNGELGGNCHVIIDYNLNGIAATGFDGKQACVVIKGESDPIECGTVSAGEVITKVSLNGDVKQEMTFKKGGVEITAKFKGIFTEPKGGKQLAGPDAIANGFSYTVPASTPNDHLIVLYAQWDWTAKGGGEAPEESELYYVVFDHNYTGGPVITEAVGELSLPAGGGEDEEEEHEPCTCGFAGDADHPACTGGPDCPCCFTSGTKCCPACTCSLTDPAAGGTGGGGTGGAGGGGGGGGDGAEYTQPGRIY